MHLQKFKTQGEREKHH